MANVLIPIYQVRKLRHREIQTPDRELTDGVGVGATYLLCLSYLGACRERPPSGGTLAVGTSDFHASSSRAPSRGAPPPKVLHYQRHRGLGAGLGGAVTNQMVGQ